MASTIILSILFILIGLLIGYWVGKLLGQSKTQQTLSTYTEKLNQQILQTEEYKKALQKSVDQINQLRTEKENTRIQLTKKEADFENLWLRHTEQKEELTQFQKKFTLEFENLATRILEEKSTKFTEQNKYNITNILQPLHEKIQHFERRVEESQKENIGIHASLKEQLAQLQQQNSKISKEAENLAKALKGDTKMQGNWGELILEKVLEKSGLEKNREFFVQPSYTTPQGTRLQPDVVINLPDGKKMIVDAKVSLTAYEKYSNEETETQKTIYLKEHIQSIKRHIEQLSQKNYTDIFKHESPDFVLLFIPIEPAFAIALNQDTQLYGKALEQNIVIVTPSTLLATLRTISSMWVNQKQQENAYEIARQAGALYDKFEGLLADLTQVGKRMNEAQSEYQNAMNKLVTGNGNIVVSIEKLKKMGAKAKKSLPEKYLERANNFLENKNE